MSTSDDPTARSRIRDAALERFGRDGINRVTIRAIAAEAGVSPALVIHHFGSKEALRQACDAHVAEMIRCEAETTTEPAAGNANGLAAMLESAAPVRRYLARAFLDGSDEAASLFDQIVDAVAAWLADGAEQGWAQATEQPRTRAVLYVSWLLAPLLLDQHIARALDVPDPHEGSATNRFAPVMVDMLTHGVFTDKASLEAWKRLGQVREERDEPR